MIKTICEYCNKEFEVDRPCMVKKRRYCSLACSGKASRKRVVRTCQECGNEYEIPMYRDAQARFCSKSCQGKWTIREYPEIRTNLFKPGNQHRKGLRPTNAFTSEQTSGENNAAWKPSIKLICAHCGVEFERVPYLVKQNKTSQYFCSHECFVRSGVFEGEKSPCWVGGPNTYRGRNWETARMKAIERDGGICQFCGKHVGDSIPVHHIQPFRDFENEEQANALDNLICACQSCHMKNEPRQTS